MNSTRGQSNLGSTPPMSRVEWAIARYNWYRACGLLDDSPQRNAENATHQRSPDPPPKTHLKWYPLSKPDDDIAATDQQPVATIPRHRYSQRVENAHPQTISTRDHGEKGPGDDPRTWSRVDWAIARYNWYRACGLLDDSPPRTVEVATYRRSPDPPPPKPHLKWYPLSKPDDEAATTDQRSVTATPPEPSRRYCQRVEHARAQAMIARYQAEKEEAAKETTSGRTFDSSKHPRAERGQHNGGQFVRRGDEGTSTTGDMSAFRAKTPSANQDRHGNLAHPGQAFFSVPPEKVESPGTASSLSWLTSWFRSIYIYTDASGNVYANKGSFWGDFKIGYENDGSVSREVGTFRYRIPKAIVQQFVNEHWDIVKNWNDEEWDLYFRIFGQAAAKPADLISNGLAQYKLESGIPLPRITAEDKRFYEGMAVFAGITTFIEVGYPIIMTEILSAIFVEALAGEIIAVGVEAGTTLVITRGNHVIKLAGKQLDEVTEYLIKSGRVKKGAKIDDVGKAFKEIIEEAAAAPGVLGRRRGNC
jgi:hypothetical protein